MDRLGNGAGLKPMFTETSQEGDSVDVRPEPGTRRTSLEAGSVSAGL